MKNKIASGTFFVLSCFAAMFVLLEFHEEYVFVGASAVVLLVSSFWFLNALFAGKSKQWSNLAEKEEDGNNSSGRIPDEFKEKVVKYMEIMNQSQNQMLQELKSQKAVWKTEVESLKGEISSLSNKQTLQTKMVVKYNKENARQLALNEKKILNDAVQELKAVVVAQVGLQTATAVEAVTMPQMEAVVAPQVAQELPVMEEMIIPEVAQELPVMEEMIIPEVAQELPVMEEMIIPEVAQELPVMEEMVVPEVVQELPAMEEIEIPEISEVLPINDLELSEVLQSSEEVPELPSMEELGLTDTMMEDLPVLDDIVVPETPPAPTFSSDPNAKMSQDDIAKLLASMGI